MCHLGMPDRDGNRRQPFSDFAYPVANGKDGESLCDGQFDRSASPHHYITGLDPDIIARGKRSGTHVEYEDCMLASSS